MHGAKFEYRAAASTPVEGIVLDRDTDSPVPGVLVRSQVVDGRTDHRAHIAQDVTNNTGRFRLTGLPVGNVALIAVPLDRPYLPAVQAATVPAKGEAKPVDFRLKRGVWIRGQVTDARTNQPVPAYVQYYAAGSNPNLPGLDGFDGAVPFRPIHRTDATGRYSVPGLPGKGIVGARVTGTKYDDYMFGVGADGIPGSQGKGWMAFFDTRPEPCTANRYHALAAVDIPARAETYTRNLKPDPGETLTGTVLDPKRQPLAGSFMLGRYPTDMMYNPGPLTTEFQVRHYSPDWPRLLLFAHREKQLAGSLLVRGKQLKALSVRLEPAGTITGKVVGADGKPAAGVTICAPLVASKPEDLTTGSVALPEAYYRTDAEGKFRIECLAPGIKYGIVVAKTKGRLASNITVKAGETKDLGDLTERE